MTIPKDLVAASATPLVLSILSRGDSYGYAIIQEIKALSAGQLSWADGMLYPILHRLEKKKLVQAYWGQADNGRRRKYYRLRASGAQELAEQIQFWRDLHELIERVNGVAATPAT